MVKNKLISIIGLIAFIATIYLLTTLLSKSKNKELKAQQELYEQLIRSKDETINIIAVMHDEYREDARRHEAQDSIFRAQVLNNRTNYIPIQKGYAQIPKNIDAISNDRRAISDAFTNY